MEVFPGTSSAINIDRVHSFYCQEKSLKKAVLLLSLVSGFVLTDFINALEKKASQAKIRTCFYHNLGRFDGLFLLKFYTELGCSVKMLCRNRNIYEIRVFRGRRLLIRFRDSLALLPLKLQALGQTLCPGPKGIIAHEEPIYSRINA